MQYQTSLISFEFLIDRSPLLAFLRSAQAVLDKKSDKVGGKVLFFVEKSRVLAMVHGSIYVEASIECISETEISFSTSCVLLYDLIKVFDASNDKIKFTITENNIKINYLDGEFSLGRFDSEEKPISLNGKFSSFAVSFPIISEKFKLISVTIPEYDVRQYFRGAHVILNSGKLAIWSSDGHRLSMSSFAVDGYESFECIWPKKFIDYICLIDSTDIAQFSIYETHVKCELKNRVFISPLVNAPVIEVNEILPSNDKLKWGAIFDSGDLSKRIERVMVLNDGSGRVLFDFDPSSGNCYLYSTNATDSITASKSREKINILKSRGDLAKMYFNGSAILSFLRNLKGLIEIKYFSVSGDIVITQDGEEYPMYLTKELL